MARCFQHVQKAITFKQFSSLAANQVHIQTCDMLSAATLLGSTVQDTAFTMADPEDHFLFWSLWDETCWHQELLSAGYSLRISEAYSVHSCGRRNFRRLWSCLKKVRRRKLIPERSLRTPEQRRRSLRRKQSRELPSAGLQILSELQKTRLFVQVQRLFLRLQRLQGLSHLLQSPKQRRGRFSLVWPNFSEALRRKLQRVQCRLQPTCGWGTDSRSQRSCLS